MNKRARSAWLFLTPALLFYAIFLIFPVLSSLYLSLHEWNMLTSPLDAKYVGWSNYSYIFTKDKVFLKALGNTFIYAMSVVPISVVLSIFLAVLVYRQKRSSIWRLIFFLPTITTPVAIGMVWMYLYRPNYGLINTILNLFGFKSLDWLNNPKTALLSIIITAIWANIGANMLILYAGLKDIPTSYYEAAAVDGASGWVRFSKITLPLLKPAILFVVVTGMISSWQVFDFIVAMTAPTLGRAGGPINSTMTMVLYMYQTAFEYMYMGRACAMAYVLLIIIMALSLILLRMFRRGGVVSY
ncbi:MAG: sugar ABC transporter permease [Bacillota bacterium]|nr:sugar ABC transporter permease [Bacillota bacterium]MDI9415261.1 sugar ABC transporter permease [Bacillota bacterium]NLD13261.1 sugar ABC transporter permease [Bacillota bacterium]HCD41534.1 sugar ABC transporter permease [Bacillota bacterium]HOB88950.1 sugar ABC transporter permease [Bacillota bacterium]